MDRIVQVLASLSGRIGLILGAVTVAILLRWIVPLFSWGDYQARAIFYLGIVALAIATARLIVLWLPSRTGQVSESAPINQVFRWLQLGLLTVILGAIWSPLVLLFLILCCLTAAPAVLENDEVFHLDRVAVATAFGLLSAGLLYVFCGMLGIDGKIVVPICLLALAAVNVWRWKGQLLPAIAPAAGYLDWAALTLFGSFAGLTLIASIMMGIGDYPTVFFNADTPLRLTHAHEILGLTQYPQEALTAKGIFRAYHYGGPAAAATLSAATGMPVHKSLFLAVIPVLLTGCFGAIWLLCRTVTNSKVSRLVAATLFVPFVGLGNEAYQQYIYTAQAHGLGMFKALGQMFVPMTFADPDHLENFGGGVWDVSTIASIFVLLGTVALVTRKTTLPVAVFAPLVFLVSVFSRIAMVPMVVTFLGLRLITSVREFHPARVFVYLLVSGAITTLALIGLGVFEAVDSSASVNSIDQILKKLDWLNERVWRHQSWQSAEVLSVTLGAVLFGLLYIFIPHYHSDSRKALLVAGALIGTVLCYGLVISLRAEDLNLVFKATWIATPMVALAILSISRQACLGRWVTALFIAPLVLIALMVHWQKYQQAVFTAKSPQYGQEYFDTTALAEALQRIPKDSSVIVTNEFRYLWVENYQTPITAIYGHQAYAVATYWLVHEPQLRDQAGRQIGEQKRLLSSLFNRTQPEFAEDVIAFAKEKGWTHFLLDKNTMGWSWRTPEILFQGSSTLGDLSRTESRFWANKSQAPFVIERAAILADRVRCARDGLEPDGKPDNVFRLTLNRGKDDIQNIAKVVYIELHRMNPPGLSHTLDHNYALGISRSPTSDLLNGKKNRVQVSFDEMGDELWLFSCADGHDGLKSRYFVTLTFEEQTRIAQYDSFKDVPLRNLFENDRYAVFAF